MEIKCPYTAQNLTPLEATKAKIINFCNIVTLEDDNVNKERLELKRDHSYYYQVQRQLAVTKKSYCIFAVWTPEDIHTESIFI